MLRDKNDYIILISFQLNSLQALNLKWNQITEVKEYSFGSLNNLKELNLNGNRLQIGENSFNVLNNLQSLYLNHNRYNKKLI